VRKLLQHGRSPLATAVAQCIGHACALRETSAADLVQPLNAKQIANIRRYPLFTGLDKPVGIELGDILFDPADLFGHDGEQHLQRAFIVARALASFLIALPVDSGQ
jgi:hypothetical protein